MADLGYVVYKVKFGGDWKSDLRNIESEADAMAARINAKLSSSVGFGGSGGGGVAPPSGAVTGSGQPAGGTGAAGVASGGGGQAGAGVATAAMQNAMTTGYSAPSYGGAQGSNGWPAGTAAWAAAAAQQVNVLGYTVRDQPLLGAGPSAQPLLLAASSQNSGAASGWSRQAWQQGPSSPWNLGVPLAGGGDLGQSARAGMYGLHDPYAASVGEQSAASAESIGINQMMMTAATSRGIIGGAAAANIGFRARLAAIGSYNLAPAIATATAAVGIAIGATSILDTSHDFGLARRFTNNTTSDRNLVRGMAQEESIIGNIPLIGGALIGGVNRTVNYANTEKQMEEATRLQMGNVGGLFGGGLAGDVKREEQSERNFLEDVQYDRKIGKVLPAIENLKVKRQLEAFRLQRDANEVNLTQRHLNLRTQADQADLQAMGMSRLADMIGVNRTFNEAITRAKDDTQENRDDLEHLRQSTIRAAMMQGLHPAHAVSISGAGAALGTGSVRIGSPSGQSAEIVALWRGIEKNTREEAKPIVAR